MIENYTIGYKVFNSDWKCRDFQYKVGGTYKIRKGKKQIAIFGKGFHYAPKLVDCFHIAYEYNPELKFAKVRALGDVIYDEKTKTCVTNAIEIVEEIDHLTALEMINSGHCNIGWNNAGNYNRGEYNSGQQNVGEHNSGYYNEGHWNSGNNNKGSWNSGHWNMGCWNAGSHNHGIENTGYGHKGERNVGRGNEGSCNVGWYNHADYAYGMFNTKPAEMYLFNKPTGLTHEEFFKKYAWACDILQRANIRYTKWVKLEEINTWTDEEKLKDDSWITTNGILQEVTTTKDQWAEWWEYLSEDEKQAVLDLPNFDAEIFKEITGISVN